MRRELNSLAVTASAASELLRQSGHGNVADELDLAVLGLEQSGGPVVIVDPRTNVGGIVTFFPVNETAKRLIGLTRNKAFTAEQLQILTDLKFEISVGYEIDAAIKLLEQAQRSTK